MLLFSQVHFIKHALYYYYFLFRLGESCFSAFVSFESVLPPEELWILITAGTICSFRFSEEYKASC